MTAVHTPRVTTRLYCHGLGDCNLLGFARADGSTWWMLIDCGIHSSAKGGRATVDAVVADIVRTVTPPGGKPRIDVVVATHEHWDHISGFLTAAALFAPCTVGEVWMAWTENPKDTLGASLDRYRGEALAVLDKAALRLATDRANTDLANGLDALLGFFGAAGDKSRAARDKVVEMATEGVRYLEPGAALPLPADVGATVYVLGPPRDAAMLGIRDSVQDTYGIDSGWAAAATLGNAFRVAAGEYDMDDDVTSPFDESEGEPLSTLVYDGAAPGSLAAFVRDHYTGDAPADMLPVTEEGDDDRPTRAQGWRRIDGDWLGASADLAMQLDSRTNNTSLVLALALDAPRNPAGNVLLFAADAQVGNWKSWPAVRFADGTTGAGLLARSVLYKVGHHGSSNATLRGAVGENGLEAMTHADLVAFVPTDQDMAKKVGWSAIPAPELLVRLGEKAGGGVVRSDRDEGVTVTAEGVRYWQRDFDGGARPPKTRRPRRRVTS